MTDLRYLHRSEYGQGQGQVLVTTPGWIDADVFPWAKGLKRCRNRSCVCRGIKPDQASAGVGHLALARLHHDNFLKYIGELPSHPVRDWLYTYAAEVQDLIDEVERLHGLLLEERV